MYKKTILHTLFPFSIAHSTFLWGDIPVSFTGSNILLRQVPTAELAIFYKNKNIFCLIKTLNTLFFYLPASACSNLKIIFHEGRKPEQITLLNKNGLSFLFDFL